MSHFDDDMGVRDSDEELLRGRAINADPALTAFVAMLRESAEVPGPRPTDALATLLRTGRAPGAVSAPAPIPVAAWTAVPFAVRVRRLTSRVAALGLAAKIALTAGVAVASVGTAAAVGAVPDAVQERATQTLGHIVAVFAPGSQRDSDDSSTAGTSQSPNGGAVLPGASGSASDRPTQTASPTDLPTGAELRGEGRQPLPEPAVSNRAVPAYGPGSAAPGDTTAPGPSSAEAQGAHATDRAAAPGTDASNGSGQVDPGTTSTPTPTPEPTHSAGRG
ncbi:hypothetical protein DDP54_07235 [Cellulomonas sp. WB94]|uniref:hypothetical protein n=1 Tax=Cellulomonas sp. WB94 TaxID=2173174 RepID=UPI000D57DBE5|nr:hypothetical protein [Cellulomonas sp. WB94]PVU82832.1 hypothetical protein DDP54_07235 [Cellulomonas sp. WB94]